MNQQEKYDVLCKIVQTMTGSLKLPAEHSGVYLNCLKGRLNPYFGAPEVSICLEDLQNAVNAGVYSWKDRGGKTWIPIRLQVWGKKKDAEMQSNDETEIPTLDQYDDLGV